MIVEIYRLRVDFLILRKSVIPYNDSKDSGACVPISKKLLFGMEEKT